MIFRERYKKEIIPAMKKEFGYKNDMEVPKISKITINVGLGPFLQDSKNIDSIIETIKKITGQVPIKTKAKKAIASFSIREGQIIGMKVTLRGNYMYEFINKLVNVAFPGVRDFRGLSNKSFDGFGNYTIGLKEHTIFPEIRSDDVENIHGLEICISTTAASNKESEVLLKLFGFPFKKNK